MIFDKLAYFFVKTYIVGVHYNCLSAAILMGTTTYSQYKKKSKILKYFFGVELIDSINDSISEASPFNKEPKYQTFVADLTSRSDLKSLLFTPKFPLKAHFTKFQFECVFHDLANWKKCPEWHVYTRLVCPRV